MMRSTLALSFALGAAGARSVVRGKAPEIEGVPLLNSHAGVEDFIVTFEEGVGEDEISKFCSGECPTFGHPEEGGFAWASVRGREALENLLKRRGTVQVAYIEPDEIVSIPDDELEGEDGELGEERSTPWGIRRVNAHNAPSSGRGAHIYVQDTGMRVSHQDFSGRATTSIDLTSGRLRECNGDPRCAADRQGHGTHCAGTAGGRTFGVARQSRLYSVKTLGDQGTGSGSWQISAIDWVASRGRRPRVLSMSLGGRGVSSSYRNALRSAMERGVVIVVAAGNENSDACGFSPAFSSDVITVGSTTSTNARSSFSNFGSCVDIMAPGSRVVSAGISSNTATRSLSGTSMACPHVSGGAALILGRNPSMSVSSVRSRIHGSSNAERNSISDLRGSANRFLFVGRRRVPGGR